MHVLIVGAGPAGLTLAACLHRRGIAATVIEKAPAARTDGYAVGLHLNGWNVAERLGILRTLQQHAMPLGEAVYCDPAGRRLFSYNYEHIAAALGGKMIAIMRDVLQRQLLQIVAPNVPIHFDRTVTALAPREDCVAVVFNDGTEHCYDLVVGADGIHSRVRELAFGPREMFVHSLGYRAAAWRMRAAGPAASFVGHMAVHRQAGLYRASAEESATLFCWRDPETAYVPPDRRQALLRELFAGWTDDVAQTLHEPIDWSRSFFDTVAQVVMPRWSAGRVVLVGDAAHCQSFFSGQGTSMAMTGAFIFAEELERRGVAGGAFAYEARMRKAVEQLQQASKSIGGKFVPASRLGLWVQSHLAAVMLSRPLVPLFARRLQAPDLLRVAG